MNLYIKNMVCPRDLRVWWFGWVAWREFFIDKLWNGLLDGTNWLIVLYLTISRLCINCMNSGQIGNWQIQTMVRTGSRTRYTSPQLLIFFTVLKWRWINYRVFQCGRFFYTRPELQLLIVDVTKWFLVIVNLYYRFEKSSKSRTVSCLKISWQPKLESCQFRRWIVQ